MRKYLIVCAAVAVALLAQGAEPLTSTQAASVSEAGALKCPTLDQYRERLQAAIRYSHHGWDYVALPIRKRGEDRLHDARECVKSRGNDRRVRTMRKRAHERRGRWHFHHRVDTATPWGKWAIPPSAVYNESRYDQYAENGKYKGWYQIGDDHYYAGRVCYGLPIWPAWAQHLCAERVLASEGPGAWEQTW